MFTSVEGMNIYRIIQEAVNNALKYADAEHIGVKIKTMEDDFLILVKDDGKGFKLGERQDGNGLNNMKKRAMDLNGKVVVKSKPGQGTTVALQFPHITNTN
jgi:signal transduction histidine kinase